MNAILPLLKRFGRICVTAVDSTPCRESSKEVERVGKQVDFSSRPGRRQEPHGQHRRDVMSPRFILTEYVSQLMAYAIYDKLEDGTFAGRIPQCKGVVAFGTTLRECEDELHSTLEDWILVGLKLGHPLPVIGEIDLNKEPTREPVDAV
jgi:predicted RNase H-like HicB family nuclease